MCCLNCLVARSKECDTCMHSLASQFDNLLQSCAHFNSINRCRNGIGMETGAKNARQGRTSFLLQHQKTVFCRRGPSDDRRQEKHKEALAEKADQAMTPPLRFSCESLHDTRPGQGAGPSRGRTGKVQRPAGRSSATSLPTTKAPASSLRSRSATLRCGVCRKSRRRHACCLVFHRVSWFELLGRSSTRRTRRSSGSRIMQPL